MVKDILKDMEMGSRPGDYDMDSVDEAGGGAFIQEEERKVKEAERRANEKLDKVLTAFRLCKNNKFAELEDLLVEGTLGRTVWCRVGFSPFD
jgi:hypothetical protein